MTDQQLIGDYLANGGSVTIIPAIEDKHEPATNLIAQSSDIEYDRHGQRVYRHLNKISYSIEQDPTTLNYG